MPLEAPPPSPPAPVELLKRKIREDQAVVIVGAGISIAATKNDPCASWPGLLETGRKFVQKNCGDQDDYERFDKNAEFFLKNPSVQNYIFCAKTIKDTLIERSSELYHQWLKDTIGSLYLKNRRPVDAIVNLGLPIATTNYDLLIEKAIEPACYDRLAFTWKAPNAIRSFLKHAAGEKGGSDPNPQQRVYHVHGVYLEPQSVVFDAADYDRHLADELAQLWQQYLATSKSIIFVGFGGGLSDPNFFRWLSWIDRSARKLDTRHFVILQDREHARVWDHGNRRQRLSNFGQWLIPVTYESEHDRDHGRLPPFLEDLAGGREFPRPPAVAAESRPTLLSRLRDDIAAHLARQGVPVYSLSVNGAGAPPADGKPPEEGSEPARTPVIGIEVAPLHRLHVQTACESLRQFPALAVEGISRKGDMVEMQAEIALAEGGTRAGCRVAIRPLLDDFARKLAELRSGQGGEPQGDGHSRHVLEAALETASRAAEPFLGQDAPRSPAIILESAPNHDSRDIVIGLMEQCDVPPELIERFRKAIERQMTALKVPSGQERREDFLGRIGELKAVADELRRILTALKEAELDRRRPEEWYRLDFHIEMERALCLAEYGSHTENRASLRDAIQLYKDIHGRLRTEDGPEPLVKYRLGRAYALNGDPDSALDRYRKGYALLKEGRWNLVKPDWLRVSLPKSIGYVCWTKANALRQAGKNHGEEKEYRIRERSDLLAEALRHTFSAYEEPGSPETNPPNRVEIETERETLVNNLLSMALEYVELHDGNWDTLSALVGDGAEPVFTRNKLDALAQRLTIIIEKDADQGIRNRYNRQDTLRHYGHMTGNAEMEKRFAEAVLDAVEEQVERGFKLKPVDCQMVEDALRSLAGSPGAREPSPALRKACSDIDEFLP